ncbi:aspartate aminotransferase family protein [Vallitalea pronyensis]|uniref:Aspartate aminotransferase family protein n=1 Tax=Vallitalea pronyensis TaxID=1348613 RepID=A0A8J8MKG4_9FIRM|nr:pyridoxal-dependent decarboxylase [Vallitalea pronyensis]QUI23310.1 aspartate aminotransferase family protein [Vallitalea pronyensis]
MNIYELRNKFPSQDGNVTQQDNILHHIHKLITGIDEKKNKNKPILGELKRKNNDLYDQFIHSSHLPLKGCDNDQIIHQLLALSEGHPFVNQFNLNNVSSLASIPSFLGNIAAILLDGNNVWDVVGPACAEAEVRIIAMLSELIGYSKTKTWGYTTWGGQGAVFSSLRLAISKYDSKATQYGVPKNLYCFASENCHYSLLKSMEATGIGSDHLILVKSNEDLSMDLDDLEFHIRQVIHKGGIPLYILATMGSTDSFSIDDIKGIKTICQHFQDQYLVKPIHIHADSAIGGMFLVFNDYNLNENPLLFSKDVLHEIEKIKIKLSPMHLADTVCFDFHKLGSTPYTSSVFMAKKGVDFKLLDLSESDTPYVGNRGYGSYHTSYTLECSRMGSSITIYAALLGMGVEGYQVLFGHYIKVTLAFRQKLMNRFHNVAIINEGVVGMITAFRFYENTPCLYEERHGKRLKRLIDETNTFNKKLFDIFGEKRAEVFLGDTTKVTTVISSDGYPVPLACVKVVIMSPYTDVQHMDRVLDFMEECIQLYGEREEKAV